MTVEIYKRTRRKEVKTSRIERSTGYNRVIGPRKAYIDDQGDLVIGLEGPSGGRVWIAREQARAFVDALHVICHDCPDITDAEMPRIVG
ncbi:hypothetical protein PUR29_34910 [Methylobacterium ajmalii]|uniref:DUF3892 domain-containing protein n=1 Tax=Methylobacterium ajmalii TaxID=2738439 RepID=A0ABV0A5G3_9HYPH